MDLPRDFTSFGEMLRFLRRRAQLTQRELGAAVGYSHAQINRLEHNLRPPDFTMVKALFLPALGIEWESEAAVRMLKLAERAKSVITATSVTTDDDAEDDGTSKKKPGNLLAQLTSFIGREREVIEVRQQVETNRLVTLTGAGGIGKTRLALEAAAGMTETFADGVWLVEFAPLRDPALIAHAVAQVLRLAEKPNRARHDTLIEYLEGKHLLLIFDTCEHLIDACADLAEQILRRCPEVHVLVTSRETLLVPSEVVLQVSALTIPADVGTDADVLSYEAVQLFVERVRAAKPAFEWSKDDVGAIAHLCRQLGGIPLALELVAALTHTMTINEVATQFESHRSLLVQGYRTAASRHQTMQHALDWSYDLLKPVEQRLLAQLSVFAGGWTAEMASAVCGGPQVLSPLHQLARKSLVLSEPHGDHTRYRLLEPIHGYADQKLHDMGDQDAIRREHTYAMLSLAQMAEPHLHMHDQKKWFERLEREHDNFRTALKWSVSETGDAVAGLELAAALWQFWWLCGHLSEGRRWLESLLLVTSLEPISQARAQALNGLGSIAIAQSNFGFAAEKFAESLELSLNLDYKEGIATAQCVLSFMAGWQKDYSRATSLIEQTLATCRELGDSWVTSWAHWIRALNASRHEDYARVTDLYEQALVVARHRGDQPLIANVLVDLALVAARRGDLGRAVQLAEEALQAAREADNKQAIGRLLDTYAETLRRSGDPDRARIIYGELYALGQELNDHFRMGEALHGLGKIARDRGEFQQASALFAQSIVHMQARDPWMPSLIPDNLNGLASVALALGQPHKAARFLGVAEAISKSTSEAEMNSSVPQYELLLTAVREQLDEASFTTAWVEGHTMTLEQAVAYAMNDLDDVTS